MPQTAQTNAGRGCLAIAASVLILGATTAPPALAQNKTPPLLPGGASSLSETYQDWQVACQVVENTKRCALSQQQAQQNGQRVLAVELRRRADSALIGTLVLPFGLLLDNGVTLAIDDKASTEALRFRTCVPAGCLVSLTFDTAMQKTLRAGTALKIEAADAEGQKLALTVSLNGFADAIDRLGALTGQ